MEISDFDPFEEVEEEIRAEYEEWVLENILK
jgi:hypothetical protein